MTNLQTAAAGMVAATMLIIVALGFLVRWLNRRRIVRWLHERGCETRIIRRAQVGRVGWDQRQICYYVEYTESHGATRRKMCLMSGQLLNSQGLFWRDIEKDDLLPGDWQCFECRARIPKGSNVCPRCGWS